MKNYQIDVPVLVIFFARPDTLEKVFESIKEARPSKLLLWQDGPRNEKDIPSIEACRKIFDAVDWECEIHTNYHAENMGCDPSTFRAQKWAFSIVDRCIVLEDDMVPSQSFYPYCKELLDKYEYDERINMICGVNHLGIANFCPNDYLFTYYGSGAWASWKRVAQGWDSEYTFLDKKYYINNLKRKCPSLTSVSLKVALRRRATGYEWWETIVGFNCFLNNRLAIIPRVNMVTNIGITANATHGSSLRMMNKRVRNLFYMKSQDLEFPIKHPEYIVPDYKYMDELSKINCLGRPWLALWRKCEYLFRFIVYGEIFNVMKRKIKK